MRIISRHDALSHALTSNALSNRFPSDAGRIVHSQWANGLLTADDAVALLIQHYKDNPNYDSETEQSDHGLTCYYVFWKLSF